MGWGWFEVRARHSGSPEKRVFHIGCQNATEAMRFGGIWFPVERGYAITDVVPLPGKPQTQKEARAHAR